MIKDFTYWLFNSKRSTGIQHHLNETIRTISNSYPHNSHLKGNSNKKESVLVLGDPPKYKLLEKADLISNKRLNR